MILLLCCGPALAALASGPPAAPHSPVLSPLLGAPFAIQNTEGNNWTTFMRDTSHQSLQPDPENLNARSVANLSLLWTFHTAGPVVSEPVVTGGAVYFGSWDGREYSVYASNGSQRWSTYLGQTPCKPGTKGQGITSTATVLNGTVYVGGGGTDWDALSASDGSVVWKVFTGNNSPTRGGGHYNWASPVIAGGYAYVGISSRCDQPLVQGQLLKVDIAKRAVAQVFNTTSPSRLGATIWSTPAINPATGTVFVATGNVQHGNNTTLDDSILAINTSSMRLAGRFQVPYPLRIVDGDFGASPTLYTDARGVPMVADADKDGLVFGVPQSMSGGSRWTTRIADGQTFSSSAFQGGSLFVGSSKTNSTSGANMSGSLRSLNATTGAVQWTVRMPGVVFGPVAAAGNLVVGAGGNELVVVQGLTGHVLFRYHATAPFLGGPTIAGARIYAGNANGDVYAFGFPLVAVASASASNGTHPFAVNFSASASGGAAGYQYSWSFGDGGASSHAAPVHTYISAGNYTVSLTVVDRAWNMVVVQLPVTASAPVPRSTRAPAAS